MSRLFDISELLHLRRFVGAVVIEGRAWGVLRTRTSHRDANFLEVGGGCRRVTHLGKVSDLLARRLRHCSAARELQGRQVDPDSEAKMKQSRDRMTIHARLRFVRDRLVPHLDEQTGGTCPAKDRSGDLSVLSDLPTMRDVPAPSQRVPENLTDAVMGRDALILGQNATRVTWKPGCLRERDCLLRSDGEVLSLQAGRSTPLMSVDAAFRSALATSLLAVNPPAAVDPDVLRASDRELAVVWSRVGDDPVLYANPQWRVILLGEKLYCCHRIPTYVVEAPDGTFRRFDPVWLRIEIRSLESHWALDFGAIRPPRGYRHTFIQHGMLCMGDIRAAFPQLWSLPLEAGIVAYMDMARRVLCAGAYEGANATPFDPNAIYSRPVVSPGEARRNGLPIYRYFRERRAA